jgi:hypothetical protein
MGVVQPGVETVRRQQFVVRATLADLPAVDHHDLVRLADGRQPVRDDQGCPAGQRGLERALHRGLGLQVEVRGRLVEHNHRRRFEQQSGQRDPLLLAARQPVPAIAGDGVKPVG